MILPGMLSAPTIEYLKTCLRLMKDNLEPMRQHRDAHQAQVDQYDKNIAEVMTTIAAVEKDLAANTMEKR